MSQRLSHENLDVYRISTQFLAGCIGLIRRFPRGHADLADQLKRAAASICLNIAEGCGKPGAADRARFYAIAGGSAYECGAVLDVCSILGLAKEPDIEVAKETLVRIASMLTRLCFPKS